MLVEKITTDPAEASHFMRGAIVRMRRARWRVVDIRPFDGCAIVTLAGLAPPHAGLERRVLTPFDTIEPIERTRRARIVKAGAWTRAFRDPIAQNCLQFLGATLGASVLTGAAIAVSLAFAR